MPGVDDVELPPAYTWRQARDAGARRRPVAQDGLRLGRASACRGLGTAAALLGADTPPPAEVEVVLRPRPVPPRRRGLVVHQRDLHDGDVVDLDGLRVTSGARTWPARRSSSAARTP